MKKALEGVRVVDLTWAYSGPFVTQQMGDFGADIIKVEHRKGDISRSWEPQYKGQSLYYVQTNRNKRSITCDLTTPEGKQIIYDLVKTADVVVENFRPGSMKAMKLDYDVLKQYNPKIIMASISGYGQNGPYKDRGAFANLAEALSGFMYLTGFPDGMPCADGVACGDSVAGLFACMGILMALYHREKTGEGQYLDVAMTDALISICTTNMIEYDVLGKDKERIGNRDAAGYPYDMFEAKDGYIFLSYPDMRDWTPFVDAIEMPELLEDPRFKTNADRIEHADELFPIINSWSRQRSRAEIAKIFEAHRLLVSPVLKGSEVMRDPQVLARDMVLEMEDPVLGKFREQGIAIKMQKTPGAIYRQAPTLGQHTDEVLREIGYSTEKIASLHESKVV